MAPSRPFQLKKQWVVRQMSLNFKHIFTFEYIYKRVREWLEEEGYTAAEGGDWLEKLYVERIDGGGGKQIWVWWRTHKMALPGNSFFKFYLDVDFHVLQLKPHEIMVEGTKVKTNKGECEVFITAKMELDPTGSWDQNFFLKNQWLQKFYLNRIYKDQIERIENELVRDSARLLGAVKQFYQLESWLPEYAGPGFHPKKGE